MEIFDINFIRDLNSSLNYNEKNIWKLEEVSDSPMLIQKLNEHIDESNNDYNLIELNDFEINEPFINKLN